MFLLQLVFLRQFVLELPEVDDLAHGWRGIGHDFDEIGFAVSRHGDGRGWRHHAQLCTVLIDDPDLCDPDLFVDASAFLLANG